MQKWNRAYCIKHAKKKKGILHEIFEENIEIQHKTSAENTEILHKTFVKNYISLHFLCNIPYCIKHLRKILKYNIKHLLKKFEYQCVSIIGYECFLTILPQLSAYSKFFNVHFAKILCVSWHLHPEFFIQYPKIHIQLCGQKHSYCCFLKYVKKANYNTTSFMSVFVHLHHFWPYCFVLKSLWYEIFQIWTLTAKLIVCLSS